jgi:hypothetical protein
MILGEAIGQFDSVLKTVLRPPKDEPDPEPVRLRVTGPAAVAAAIAVVSLLLPVPYGVMRSEGFSECDTAIIPYRRP